MRNYIVWDIERLEIPDMWRASKNRDYLAAFAHSAFRPPPWVSLVVSKDFAVEIAAAVEFPGLVGPVAAILLS